MPRCRAVRVASPDERFPEVPGSDPQGVGHRRKDLRPGTPIHWAEKYDVIQLQKGSQPMMESTISPDPTESSGGYIPVAPTSTASAGTDSDQLPNGCPS